MSTMFRRFSITILFTFWITFCSSEFPDYSLLSDEDYDIADYNFTITMDEKKFEPAYPSIIDIYPEVVSDLTRVTWAHGVDSRRRLQRALRSRVMMIETDVSLGKLKGDASTGKRPIMAHPPIKTSDLSLEDFLDTVIKSSQSKGIKLDFKSTSVLDQAFMIIKSREAQIMVPLWLNADIIRGPLDSTADPINPTTFLQLSKLYFPSAVLSVGWTTRYGPTISEQLTVIKDGFYTFDQVREMRDALVAAQIVQPVTFPIRAGLSTSAQSRENILWLLDQIPGSTVTIWGSFGDEVDLRGLLDLINLIGKNRVYMDVHSGLRCQISRYRTFYAASSWLGSWWVGRTARISVTTGVLTLLGYLTCATSYLPWNTESYIVQ